MIDIIKKVEEILKNGNIEEYKIEAKMIVQEISGLSLEEILLSNEVKNKEKILEIAQERAKTKRPIQHLLGYCYFMEEKYKVNNKVLIPRDETEIVVLEAYKKVKDIEGKIDILDIGVGSGCISCALAKKLIDKNIEILDNSKMPNKENLLAIQLV